MFVKIMFLNKHNFFKKQKFVCLKKKTVYGKQQKYFWILL